MFVLGFARGILCSVIGRWPDRMVDCSSGLLTADDSPEDTSPRVCLSILVVIILMGLTAAAITVGWL